MYMFMWECKSGSIWLKIESLEDTSIANLRFEISIRSLEELQSGHSFGRFNVLETLCLENENNFPLNGRDGL